MKTFSLLACSLAMACVLPSCVYDDYGYTSVGYSSPRYVTTYPSYVGPTYYRTGYSSFNSPYRTYYPRTYTTSRYLAPVGTRTYVSGYPLHPYMSVGGYGYIPPTPRPEPWPLR
jgi:hypothetical protein